jgi:hypothetical protein
LETLVKQKKDFYKRSFLNPLNCKTIIWSFNGSRFDHVLLLPYLLKRINVKVFGTMTNIKIMVVAN